MRMLAFSKYKGSQSHPTHQVVDAGMRTVHEVSQRARAVILLVQSIARSDRIHIAQYLHSRKFQLYQTISLCAKGEDTAHRTARTCLYLLEASTAPAPGQLHGAQFRQIAAPPQIRRVALLDLGLPSPPANRWQQLRP